MANGEWRMEDGEWRMEDGEWRMEDGEWRMANGEWRMANGEWSMENGEWRMENVRRVALAPSAGPTRSLTTDNHQLTTALHQGDQQLTAAITKEPNN